MKYTILLVALFVFCNFFPAQAQEGGMAMIAEDIPAVRFEQDGLYGLKHYSTGKVILPAIYLSIEDKTSSGRFIVTQRDQRKGLYHAWSGKMLIPVEFSKIEIEDNLSYEDVINHGKNDSTFLALVEKDERKGVYFFGAKSQNIPAEFNELMKALPTGHYIGIKNNRYYLFDSTGKSVATNQKKIAVFQSDRNPTSFIQITNDQGKQRMYDSNKARYILPGEYDQAIAVYYGMFIVSRKGKYGMVNAMSKEIVPIQYDTLAFVKSYPVVTLKAAQKKRYAMLSLKNKVLTKFEYNDITNNGPFYTVKLDEGYSIIDSTGNRITAVYDHIGIFYKDTCTVELKNRSGYMLANGKVTLLDSKKGCGYSALNDLYNGLVKALKADNDTALIDFCKKIVFDQGTCEFMRRVNFSYRGVPHQIFSGRNSIKAAVESYAEHLRRFQEQLRKNNELQSLRFISTDNDYDRKPMGSESIGILSTGKNTYNFEIGELLLLDNYWKAFTLPEWKNK